MIAAFLWFVGFRFGEAENPGPNGGESLLDDPEGFDWDQDEQEDDGGNMFGECDDWEPCGDETFCVDESVSGLCNGEHENQIPNKLTSAPFIRAKCFGGSKRCYVFKFGGHGLGYYWDDRAAEELRAGTLRTRGSELVDLIGGLDGGTGALPDNNSIVIDATPMVIGKGDTASDIHGSLQAQDLPIGWPDYISSRDPCVLAGTPAQKVQLPIWDLVFGAVADVGGPKRRPDGAGVGSGGPERSPGDADGGVDGQKRRPRRKNKRKRVSRRRGEGVCEFKPSFVHTASTWHRDEGLWAIDTVNPNSSGGALKYLSSSNAEIVLVQEAKTLEGDPVEEFQRAAKAVGWGLSVAPALLTEANGVSAGAACAAKACIGMTPNDCSHIPHIYRVRISSVHCNVICRGGVHFVCAYFWDSEGLSQRNLLLLHHIAQLLESLHGPWVLAADFNFSPELLTKSGWLDVVHGKIAAPEAPTCGHNTFDYFVVCRKLAGAVVAVAIVDDAGLHPHSPSRLFVKGRPRNEMVRVLVHPRKIPAILPSGCEVDASRFEGQLEVSEDKFDQCAVSILKCVDIELTEAAGLSGKDAQLASGREKGPKLAMKPALGNPGSARGRCSKITCAWDSVASWLKLLLIHWGAGYGSRGHMHTLVKTRWNLCYWKWDNLGDSISVRYFIKWCSRFTSSSLHDKVWVLLMYRSTKAIAAAAHSHDQNSSRQAWVSWLHEGPAKGLGRQHRMSRIATGWIPARKARVELVDGEQDVDDDVQIVDDTEGVREDDLFNAEVPSLVPLGSQQTVDVEAEAWASIWRRGAVGTLPKWPKCMGEKLPSTSVVLFRLACMTFPCEVGLGWDKVHPRALCRLSDAVTEALIALLMVAEITGRWYSVIGFILVVLIPKSDGGRRPIGLFPTMVRVWMRVRLRVAQDWVNENDRPYFYAGPAKGADVAAWKQALLAESAKTLSLPYIASLLDLIKAFDSVPFDCLAECAQQAGYNLYMLRLSISAYLLGRVLVVEGCCSKAILAMRGLTAGSVMATIELRVLLIKAADRMVAAAIYSRLTLFVDDSTVETVCTCLSVVSEHAKAMNQFVSDLKELRLDFSLTKNVTCASTNALAAEANGKLVGLTIKVASRVASLGSGLGAGTRRNMAQMSKRLAAFRHRSKRFKKLRAVGVRTEVLLRTGGNQSMLFGQRALGVSSSFLAKQRTTSAAATCVNNCGANLDITLALADGKTLGSADPAFEGHVGVVHFWSLAIWENWAPPTLLQANITDAMRRLDRARNMWNVVFGPAAACVATLNRLGWSILSAWEVIADDGENIDMRVQSPEYVKQAVTQSVARWRWRRVEKAFPSLRCAVSGDGPAWRPILKALNCKDTDSWGQTHKGAFRSLVAGRQWTQARLAKAQLVESPLCQLCLHLPGGGVPGTLLHRHVCPALAGFHEVHRPKWITDHLVMYGSKLNSSTLLALTRGLLHATSSPERDPRLFDTFIWVKRPLTDLHIPEDCRIFTDGSLQDGTMQRGCQSLGWSFVVINSDNVMIAAAYGVPPKWVTTIQGAELWATQCALASIPFPQSLYTDCDTVRLGLRRSMQWAGSAKRRFARIWSTIKCMLDHGREFIHWIPAHTTESNYQYALCSDGLYVTEDMWEANQLADLLAKHAAESVRLSLGVRSAMQQREKKILELVKYVGKLTHEANHLSDGNGKFLRDSNPGPKRARKGKKGRKSASDSSKASPAKKSSSDTKSVRGSGNWMAHFLSIPCGMRARQPSKAAKFKYARERLEADAQASFVQWWREARVQAPTSSQVVVPACELSMAFKQREAVAVLSRRLDRRRCGPEAGQQPAKRVRCQSNGPVLVRSHVVSAYEVPSPDVPRRGLCRPRDEISCSLGFCGECGDSLSTPMHVNLGGPCGSIRRESARAVPPISDGVLSNVKRCRVDPISQHRVGVSADGRCLACHDAMSTPMHLANGPCIE